MKIFEKKCPNCSANLEFKFGDRDIKCDHCRRTFAVEYDHEKFVDPEVQLKAKDIQLKMMDDFMKARSFSKIFIAVVMVLIVGMIIFGIVSAINARNDMKKHEEEYQSQQEEWNEKFQKEYNDAEDRINEIREGMDSETKQ